ncbi:flavin reductase family protein [Leifsonia kafniensis]|uniref:Flavin reductase family protein n=1 Tax=Leifsonia kafniensis TaxID=475957 RepID=A0ABP7KZ42_9MICO
MSATLLESQSFERATFTPQLLRSAFGCFPSGVVAVCAEVDGVSEVLIASSFVTVSLEPPLVAIFPQTTSQTWPRLARAERLGVSILSEQQAGLARSMSARTGDRFADANVTRSDGGALLVDGASVWMEVSLESSSPAGDHEFVLLGIERVTVHEAEPTVFHSSKFRQLIDLHS